MSKVKQALPVVFLGSMMAMAGYGYYQASQPKPIIIQGQIEAEHYNVAAKIAGRIADIQVEEGDDVTAGDLLFTLDSPELEAKLSQAEGGVLAAKAVQTEAENGARKQQIIAARDQWQQAKSAAELYAKTYQRVQSLFTDGVLSQQRRDEAYTQWQAAQFKENAAKQQYLLAQEGARDEKKVAAQGQTKVAQARVAEVESYKADTQMHSLYQGEVARVLLQPGELASQGFPVVTIVDMDDNSALFNVREDLLSAFSKDTVIEAKIPALGQQTFPYRVKHISLLGDFATWRSTDASKGFDLRTFEVEAVPVNPIEGLRVGMSVMVTLPADTQPLIRL